MREVLRLTILTFLLSQADFTLDSDFNNAVPDQIKVQGPNLASGVCSLQVVNRQLRDLISDLLENAMNNILTRLHQMLRDTNGHGNWTPTFFVVLGLAILYECIQRSLHDATVLQDPHDAAIGKERAYTACRMIDERFDFLTTLFQLKHNSRCNPLYSRRNEHMVSLLGEATMRFVWSLCQLVTGKCEFPIWLQDKLKHSDIDCFSR